VVRNEAGEVIEATLARAESFDGVPCAAAQRVEFYGDGTLQRATLAEEHDFGDIRCAADREFELFAKGAFCRGTLARPIERDGIEWEEGSELVCDPTGEVLRGTPRDDREIGGVPCRGGSPVRLVPHRERVMEASLSRDVELGGWPCAEDTEIAFGLEGEVRRFTPSEPVRVRRMVARPGEPVELDVYGQPRQIVLDRDKRIYGQRLPAGTRASFESDLRAAHFEPGGELDWSVRLGPGDEVELSNWGGARVELGEARGFRDVELTAGAEIWFRRDGTVQYLELADALELEGVRFAAGAVLEFDGRQRLRGAELREEHCIEGAEVAPVRGHQSARWHKNGAIAYLLIAEELERGGERYGAYTELHFDRGGAISRAE
jgi:hypothetical protein